MLPARNRMRRSVDFTDAVRRGVRGGARRLVVHLTGESSTPTGDRDDDAVLVGFVVPKAIGGAVVRNRVKRRLRSLMAARVDQLEPSTRLVIRGLPPAADATSDELARDLDTALAVARRRSASRSRR